MSKRIAARAVIIDRDLNTPILSVCNAGYFKIPGGKIEPGEELSEGLNREIKEEAGCQAEVLEKVGEFEFFMEDEQEINHSTCYLAKLIGEKGNPHFDAGEKEKNFKLLWLNIDKAIETFENCTLDSRSADEKAMHNRDLNFLRKAKEIIECKKPC